MRHIEEACVGGIISIKSSFRHNQSREMDSEFEYLFTDLRKAHNRGHCLCLHSPDVALRCARDIWRADPFQIIWSWATLLFIAAQRQYGIDYLVRERTSCNLPISGLVQEKGGVLEATIVCVGSWRGRIVVRRTAGTEVKRREYG